jgi:hypothetical protein
MSRLDTMAALSDEEAAHSLPKATRAFDDLLAAAEEAFRYVQARHPIEVSVWGVAANHRGHSEARTKPETNTAFGIDWRVV